MARALDPLPAAARIERELRRRILDGVFRVHSYLPSQRQLAQDLGTSRVTVGKALEALEREGLVTGTPGRGTRVLPAAERVSQPRIGIIYGEITARDTDAPHDFLRLDSLRTFEGARDTFERLGYKYDLMSVPRGHNLPADHFLSRFGALCFIERAFGNEELIADLERRQAPTVVAKLEGDLDARATWVDHQASMCQAVQTFVSLGHQRIAFIGRETGYGFHGQARQGYLAGLREAGLPVEESLIAVCEKTDALSAYLATRPLLQAPDPPTAIVAARDTLAEGVCHAVEEAGLTVGLDVSVIGFDDTTWPEGRKFLTTFREACYELGAVAAEMLVERIANGWAPPEKRKIEALFVLRRSAGPCFRRGQALGRSRTASLAAGPVAPGHEPAPA